MSPFPFAGKTTHDSTIKKLTLRLDADDEDAEAGIRTALENRTEKDLRRALHDMLETHFPQGYGEFIDPQIEAARIHREFMQDKALRDAVERALVDGVDLGVRTSVTQFENIGFGFNWTLANEQAREWAVRYTDELLNQLGTSSGRLVGQALSRWIVNQEPLSALIKDLAPVFGEKRAELIASTEITRAFAQGTLAGYAAAGYGESQPTEPIPQHPRCRCWYSLQINNDNSAYFIFRTSADERVCPICGPLNGANIGVARAARQLPLGV